MLKQLLVCSALSLALSSCAELQFSATDNGGVAFHPTKEFLVLTCDKDGSQTASIVHLVDDTTTRWVKPKGGFGSANLTAKFENGALTEFGQETDTKIPDTITSIAGLVTALAPPSPGMVPPQPTACKTRILKYENGVFSELAIP